MEWMGTGIPLINHYQTIFINLSHAGNKTMLHWMGLNWHLNTSGIWCFIPSGNGCFIPSGI